MKDYKTTRGDGWNVLLSASRLLIVEAATGRRRADFVVDAKLLDALRLALTETETETELKATGTKKKTTRKKATK